jgi:hypothetical protein
MVGAADNGSIAAIQLVASPAPPSLLRITRASIT